MHKLTGYTLQIFAIDDASKFRYSSGFLSFQEELGPQQVQLSPFPPCKCNSTPRKSSSYPTFVGCPLASKGPPAFELTSVPVGATNEFPQNPAWRQLN